MEKSGCKNIQMISRIVVFILLSPCLGCANLKVSDDFGCFNREMHNAVRAKLKEYDASSKGKKIVYTALYSQSDCYGFGYVTGLGWFSGVRYGFLWFFQDQDTLVFDDMAESKSLGRVASDDIWGAVEARLDELSSRFPGVDRDSLERFLNRPVVMEVGRITDF